MGVRISGYSDDVVVVQHDGEAREVPCLTGHVAVHVGPEGSALVVRAEYGPPRSGPVWRLSVEQEDEHVPLPGSVRVEPGGDYSLAIVVDCPPGTPVRVRKHAV